MKAFIGRKKLERYRGLTIMADLRLHEQVAAAVRQQVPLGGRILDLGAGQGALSARLTEMGYSVHAVDTDAVNFAFPEVEFTRVNFDRPAELESFVGRHEASFDAVLGIEVIEHVQDQWFYVNQLLRLTAPGGLVLITTPNTTSWLSRMTFLFRGRFHQFADDDLSYGHISPITPWELTLILSRTGATDIDIHPAGTLPPLYLTGLNKVSVLSVLALLLRPAMRGLVDGWCIMATARRPE